MPILTRLNSIMTRTMIRVVLFLFVGWYSNATAGARKDYADSSVECVTWSLEGTDSTHYEETICYETANNTTTLDPRIAQVRQFFRKYKSPAAKYAETFIQVADENDLDWRLLPMLAFVETGGGKYKHNNNIFGWGSGKIRFSSVEQGIRTVGASLQKGPYKGKNVLQKIKVYNTHAYYVKVALRVMKQIEKCQPLDVSQNFGMINIADAHQKP